MYERINKLVTTEKFELRSWDDRYSKGVWVCIAQDSSDLDEIESASSAGDLDIEPATDFLLSASWLPFVVGSDFTEALSKLENRLLLLPEEQILRSSKWSWAVSKALEHFREVSASSSDSYGYGGMDGKFHKLSSNYEQIWADS